VARLDRSPRNALVVDDLTEPLLPCGTQVEVVLEELSDQLANID